MMFPFDLREGLIIIPERLTGPAGNLILRVVLGTGATRTVIHTNRIISLGYDPSTSTEYRKMITGSGTAFVPVITLEKIDVLAHEQHNFSVLCHTPPSELAVDGVPGLDFFRGKRLILDFRAGLVIIE